MNRFESKKMYWLLGLSLCVTGCADDPVDAVTDTESSTSGASETDGPSVTSSATVTATMSATEGQEGSSGLDDTSGTQTDGESESETDGMGRCGDGQVDEGEMCDDGNGNDHDDCPDGPLGSCQPASCDDGLVHDQEGGGERFVDCGPGCPVACPSGMLISELTASPDGEEFIELHNPGSDAVDLSYVYLANVATYYDPGAALGAEDFRVGFPAGQTLGAGEYLVVSLAGGTGHQAVYGDAPDFDVDPADAAAPALEGDYRTPHLGDASGMIVLYGWDGTADLVLDIDYVVYGDSAAGMDKTGVGMGMSTYEDETARGDQSVAPAPLASGSSDRCAPDEPGETLMGGNGMSGHDETSEDLAGAFIDGLFPTPGEVNACGQCLETLPSMAMFSPSAENYGGNLTSWGPQLGDLDGDGDLDAFACRTNGDPHLLLLNDGDGTFTDPGFPAGGNCRSTGMGDVDGDGDLDLYINLRYGDDQVWLNDGAGGFTDSGQALAAGNNTYSMDMGDLDGDGDPDVLIGLAGGGANQVWLNDGAGVFTDSGQALGAETNLGLALGDLDGDGDLDLFATTWGGFDRVWINDGAGVFTDSGQLLDNRTGRGVGLGDVDGDGDVDAVVANNGSATNSVWLNDGAGTFTDSGQGLGAAGNTDTMGVDLADLDGDGDLDIVFGNETGVDTVWTNDGAGVFTDSGQLLDPSDARHVVLGDLDGDCDVDAFVVNQGAPATVWLND